MSQESTTRDLVELTRRTFDAYNPRDFDAITRFVAPDAVYEAVSLGTTFEGVAAIRGFFEDWLGAYEGFEMESEEILDLGNGVVFVVARLTGRPVGSAGGGLMRRRPLAFMWVEGLVARVTAYADSVDEGRAAAERLAESRGQAVSQANVETMHEFVDAWNRGDLERFLALASPEWEWHPARSSPARMPSIVAGRG
jgi:ketosteroid isomerase-like protein